VAAFAAERAPVCGSDRAEVPAFCTLDVGDGSQNLAVRPARSHIDAVPLEEAEHVLMDIPAIEHRIRVPAEVARRGGGYALK